LAPMPATERTSTSGPPGGAQGGAQADGAHGGAHTGAHGSAQAGGERRWTFLTNHGHLLLAVARSPDARVHELAAVVGITERAALLILRDLEDADYLHRTRVGRRTRYTLHRSRPLRHPADAGHSVDELLAVLADDAGSSPSTEADRDARR